MRVGTQVTREHASGPDSSFGTAGGPITILLLYIPGSPSKKNRAKHNITN